MDPCPALLLLLRGLVNISAERGLDDPERACGGTSKHVHTAVSPRFSVFLRAPRLEQSHPACGSLTADQREELRPEDGAGRRGPE